MQHVATLWLFVACVSAINVALPDGDELKLQIDPTNKESIRINIDGEEVFIPLSKPPPTLQETFNLPGDLIKGLNESPDNNNQALPDKLSDSGPVHLGELFSEKSFASPRLEKFDPVKFQRQVDSYARELKLLIDDNEKDANIDNVFVESSYLEDKILDLEKKSLDKWDNDPKSREVLRRIQIPTDIRNLKDAIIEIRVQKSQNDPDFDKIKKYIKTTLDYNSNLLNREEKII